MTGWSPHQIPITVTPLPGEGLDSWLERYARRLRVCSDDLLTHVGLTSSPLARMVTMLHPREREIITTTTGVDPATLTAMTLQPFNGIAVTINPATRAVDHSPAWRRQAGSRFCPSCLNDNDGAWELRWRLTWTFACPTHSCLLADTCPHCQRRVTPHRRGSQGGASIAGACTSPAPRTTRGGRPGPCAHPLSQAEVQVLPGRTLVMHAQHRIDSLLSVASEPPSTGASARAKQILSELHVLAYKALNALHISPDTVPENVRTVLSECGSVIPARRGALDSYDAHTIAVASAIAVLAHRPDITGQAVLTWIIDSDRRTRQPPEPNRLLHPWKDADPDLNARILTILEPHLEPRERLTYSTAGRRPRLPSLTTEQINRRVSALPTTFWPSWSIRLLTGNTHTAPAGISAYRAVLSAMTLIPGTGLTYARAGTLLGARTTHSAHAVVAQLPPDQQNATLTILTDLAAHLDEEHPPIDYTRRRNLFTGTEPAALIDMDAYARLAAVHGYRPLSPLQRRLLGDHLAVLLTGAHPGRPRISPPTSASSRTTRRRRDDVDIWNPLTFTLPPRMRAFVHHQGRELLHRHTISEPLTWQPPLPATPTPWPGIDPGSIDPQEFAQALTQSAAHPRDLRRISETFGVSSQHIQLYTQIVDQQMSDDQWNELADITHEVQDPAGLRRLYCDQDLSLRDIARFSLTSEATVRNTLAANGTTLLSSRPHHVQLSPDWFRKNYLDTPRTLTQVAAVTGYARGTLEKRAREHGIPTHRHDNPYNPFASWSPKSMPPRAVIIACSGPHGLQYVREMITLSAHSTRRAAAATLNITERQLSIHRIRIELLTGITLFEPPPGLSPTLDGADFLKQATQALHHFNTRGRS